MTARHRAFAALLAGGTPVRDAAEAVRISERTARRWCAREDVSAEVRRVQDANTARLAGRLSRIAAEAVEVIAGAVEGAKAPGAPAESAMRIATAAFDRFARFRESAEVEARLRAVEERLGLAHGGKP